MTSLGYCARLSTPALRSLNCPPQSRQGNMRQPRGRDAVAGVLRPVGHAGAALVELPATVAAAEPAIALGGALRPLRHRRRAAAHAVPPRTPPPWLRRPPAE